VNGKLALSEVERVDDNLGYGKIFQRKKWSWHSLTVVCARRTLVTVKRKFHVTLIEHDEGVSVSCPELPGCHSQGANVEEALQNIQDAIREYLEVYGEPETRCEIREMEVVTA
jgi:predicted RNase H-like HicB family nuclease